MPSPTTENSRWYVEDGSGRMTQLIQRSNGTERAFAYVGFAPDPRSVWLSDEWGGHFIFQHHLYDTEGDVLGLRD